MNNKKVGTSMGGAIEYTRNEKTKKFIQKKDNQKKKRAKSCIDCEHNKDGYCNKHKGWCGKVNYICTGDKNPYENISKPITKNKVKKLKCMCSRCKYSNDSGHCTKLKRNNDKALLSCKMKYFIEKNELGQVLKPNFDKIIYRDRKKTT